MRGFAMAGACWCLIGALAFGLLSDGTYAQQTDAATRQYAAAAALQNRGAYSLAAEEWQRFIGGHKSDDRIGRAYHYLGACYYQEAKYSEALAVFQKALAEFPKSELAPSTHLHLGATQFALAQAGRREMYDRAIETLRALLSKYPSSEQVADATYYLGESFYAQGKRQEAIAHYGQFLQKYPNHRFAAEALYALGVAQEESGDRAGARASFTTFVARFGEHRLAAEVTMRLGEVLLAEGRAGEAAKRFAEAASRPDFSMADYAALRRADAAAQQKQFSQAAALYAEMAAKFPQSQHVARAWLSAGRSLCLAGQYADAQAPLNRAIQAGGSTGAEAAHWLAQSLLKQKQPAEAVAAVEKALPRAGEGPWAAQLLLDRADAVYEIAQRRKESIGLYAEVAAKYPKEPVAPQALYMAGLAALECGDPSAALAHAGRFRTAYPDHPLMPDVLHVEAEAHVQRGAYAEADAAYRQALDKYANHPEAEVWKVRRVVALHAQKKYAEAIQAGEALLAQLRSPDGVAEARYVIGSSQLHLKQYAGAIQSLSASLTAQPKWRQADETCLALAEAYRLAGELEKAKAAVRRVISELPQSRLLDRAYYRLGTYHAQGAEPGPAAEAFRTLLAQWPQSELAPYALYELGCAQLSQKDAAGAEASFSTFLTRHAEHGLALRARYARAMARHQQSKFAPAVEDLQAVLSAGPSAQDKSDARFLLGLCHVELKQFDQAAGAFRDLLNEDPKYAAAEKVVYQLGWAWKLAGQEAKAAKAFARLAAEFPQSPLVPEAEYNVGEAHFQAKDYLAAAKAYYACIEKAGATPLCEKAVCKLGWCYYHQGNFVDAQKTFGYQLAKFPGGPLAADAAFMAAECLFKQHLFAEALAAYGKLKPLANREYQAAALLHAGQAAGQLKQWSESVRWLERFARECADSPELPEALYELGWARQNLGRTGEALTAYENVIAKTDREVAARAQFMIGEIQFQRKEHEEAVRSFFKVIYGYQAPRWQADAAYEAARCFEVLGQKTQAASMYQELLEKFPQSDKVPLAKQRLAELKTGS